MPLLRLNTQDFQLIKKFREEQNKAGILKMGLTNVPDMKNTKQINRSLREKSIRIVPTVQFITNKKNTSPLLNVVSEIKKTETSSESSSEISELSDRKEYLKQLAQKAKNKLIRLKMTPLT